jgi:hypothetical protein
MLSLLAAFAVTIGNDIYIREEAYKEGSIETDKILLHEMVHALQNKNNVRITNKDERKKAEAEAEQAEHDVYGDIWSEPVEIIEMGGRKCRMTKREKSGIIDKTVNSLEKWLEEQKIILPEDKYFYFLCDIEDFLDHPSLKIPKTAYEAMQLEIEEKFRKKLY